MRKEPKPNPPKPYQATNHLPALRNIHKCVFAAQDRDLKKSPTIIRLTTVRSTLAAISTALTPLLAHETTAKCRQAIHPLAHRPYTSPSTPHGRKEVRTPSSV